MMKEKYKYLFPYEKIPKGSKILIYGAGVLGQDYYLQLCITGYCDVVGFIDRNYVNYVDSVVPVYSPQDIGRLDFAYVAVALRTKAAFNEIRRVLRDSGVADERIIAVFERQYDSRDLFGTSLAHTDSGESIPFAYEANVKSIAFLTTGGYGDMVIQKRLIMEIIRLVGDCKIDIYNMKAVDFLQTLYTDTPNVRNIIPDLGSRYLQNSHKYKLSITIEACHFVKVDFFDEEFWRANDVAFFDRISLLIQRTAEEAADILMPVHVTLYRRWMKGYNVYTGFNYDGVFEITDKKVNIPLDVSAGVRFQQIRKLLEADKYITVNCGNGDCADGTLVAKSWPVDYFETFVAKIGDAYPNISVIQLGDDRAHKIKGCDEYFLGREFALVEWVLKNSALHVDIEGGLVHIASQLGTKCIVLFGPTVKEYYGYEGNVNISVGNCHDCWGLYSDVNKCARDMKEPECMYSISPELVYKYVKEELDRK